ncbi:MAG: hypothetical protein HOE14_10930 [Gemmatimonadales bacterium]|jgi:hypothetical protein|nr:hypothetical protein [Gemmatimonadales bacterium]MBT7693267.1 hypothetical protein [Gemmatimonadales bacterium]
MTAQQLDRVLFQRRKYYLLGSHSVDEQEVIGPLPGEPGFSIGSFFERDYANTWSPGLFRPDTWGIRTAMISTACYRGFVATYVIKYKYLLLRDLEIQVEIEDEAPDPCIAGQPPSGSRHFRSAGIRGLWFTRLDYPTLFSGDLLLGGGAVVGPTWPGGWPGPETFEFVHQCRFEEGRLVDAAL